MIFHSRFVNWSEHNLLKWFKPNGWEASLTNWKHVSWCSQNLLKHLQYYTRYSFIWFCIVCLLMFVRGVAYHQIECVTMLERISSGVCICIVMEISNRTINHCACPADIIIETGNHIDSIYVAPEWLLSLFALGENKGFVYESPSIDAQF